MTRNKIGKQAVLWLLFLAYLALLVYLMIFSEAMGRTQGPRFSYNLVPFREIRRCLERWEITGIPYVLVNLVGNVAVFMPFGYLLPKLLSRIRGFSLLFLCSFLTSLLLECQQFLCQAGSFDVDDMILNTAGGLLGYVCFLLFEAGRKRGERKESLGGK